MGVREWCRAVLTAAAMATVLSACGGGGAARTSRGSADVLTAAEMEPMAGRDLLTVIERMRPRWLQTRLAQTTEGVHPVSVVVNGLRQDGGPEILRQYVAADVLEVRFLNSRDATTTYGLQMMSGALVVTLKR
jgi:hypothetical protein